MFSEPNLNSHAMSYPRSDLLIISTLINLKQLGHICRDHKVVSYLQTIKTRFITSAVYQIFKKIPVDLDIEARNLLL